jgi:hypothetical protein
MKVGFCAHFHSENGKRNATVKQNTPAGCFHGLFEGPVTVKLHGNIPVDKTFSGVSIGNTVISLFPALSPGHSSLISRGSLPIAVFLSVKSTYVVLPPVSN